MTPRWRHREASARRALAGGMWLPWDEMLGPPAWPTCEPAEFCSRGWRRAINSHMLGDWSPLRWPQQHRAHTSKPGRVRSQRVAHLVQGQPLYTVQRTRCTVQRAGHAHWPFIRTEPQTLCVRLHSMFIALFSPSGPSVLYRSCQSDDCVIKTRRIGCDGRHDMGSDWCLSCMQSDVENSSTKFNLPTFYCRLTTTAYGLTSPSN